MRSFQRVSSESERWLDDEDRLLLALWWQEAAGTSSCAGLTHAIRHPPLASARFIAHMARSLPESRVDDRSLRRRPVCGGLATAAAGWDRKSACRNRLAANCRHDPKLSRLPPYV